AADILSITTARNIADQIDTVSVRHVSGEASRIAFKSYQKGREKWQAETLDWVWFDEEPPIEIYMEGVTRTNATNGLQWLTCTPLKGMSDVVSRFMLDPNAGRQITQMSLDEVGHLTARQRARIIAQYPPHEVEARTKGVPVMGSGRVFPVAEGIVREDGPQ